MEKILTVPAPAADDTPVFATGNHHVSLTHIAQNGALLALSHLSRAGNCLIEHTGAPLLALYAGDAPLAAATAAYIDDFIPTFTADTAGCEVEWKYYAPEGIRGFCVRVRLRARQAAAFSLRLRYAPAAFARSLFHSHELSGAARFALDEWTQSAVMELTAGFGLSALALAGSVGFAASVGDGFLEATHSINLAEGEETTVEFYAALGAERDGASLACMDMRRREASLYQGCTALLRARHVPLPGNPVLEARANLNLNFCYYFSLGYPLDGTELWLLTSKSSRYYVSGAYWARDCMLWAFPAILRVDVSMAEEALLAACTTYLREGANHALYPNGANLYPGFELDELVAPIIALGRYLRATGNTAFARRSEVEAAAAFTLEQLARWRDEVTGLYRTELSPSDDPVAAPCLIYNNALVLAALKVLDEHHRDLTTEIGTLQTALDSFAKTQVDGIDIYAWAVGGEGPPEVYDNPPGSLLLMPYYGWPAADDPVYQNTVRHYFSAQNPWFTQSGTLRGQGCEHAQNPWPISLCNRLLAGGHNEELLAALRAMPMDNGIACETVQPDTGKLCTGAAFATFAGFYASAILEACGL